ncbi:MAG TPA: ribonuclease J, partial [Verrucomicrobiae bacterium]|nr:ribonuclease J [Verrucomicrobiae bacterium]
LMGTIRQYLKQKVARSFGGKKVDLDVIKKELKDEITHILYDQTRRTPIVIPVVNEIGGGGNAPQGRNRPGDARGNDNRGNNEARGSKEGSVMPNLPPQNFPPRQVPDTEVVEPRARTDTRAY